ncbi:MAG: hypothetical protein KAV87_35515 [Desulfobacteraceae bacterium]|nr:hypothetical protein [Desulfobacteraceae bacterium]
MIKASNFERALHRWEPWLRGVKNARLQSHLDSDTWWAYAKAVMRNLHFPNKPLLCLYFLSCVFSEYEINGAYCFENIQLPPILFDKFDSLNTRIAGAIWRFTYVLDFLRIGLIRLCPDLMGMRERPLPPAVWNEHDVKLALQWERHHGNFTYVGRHGVIIKKNNPYEQLLKYYSPFFMVLAPDHAILGITSKIKRKIDDALAVLCAEMKDVEGYTYLQIGEKFGWALQEGSQENLLRCSTAQRYVRRGRKLRGW